MRAMLWKLRWVIAAALLVFGTGCIKVRHLGDDVSKSFYKTFRAQRRRGDPDARVWLKPMEAELASKATDTMVGKESRAARNAPRTFTVPAAPQSSGDDN
ncbi:MAG: hypothetical protein KC503_07230 [Myxococcales bacterium]|nr:hypothetical protein [Myxococcales bacterium]